MTVQHFSNKRRMVRNAVYLFIVITVLVISSSSYTDESYLALLSCQLNGILSLRQGTHTELLDCSNINQNITRTDDSLVLHAAEVDGWGVYSVKSGSKFGSLVINVAKDRDQLIFYPRLPNPDTRVVVYDVTNNIRKLVCTITNTSKNWIPIGSQYSLCTQCFRYSNIHYDVAIQIEIQLIGTNSQLWVKDRKIFF